jgi:hypothetical protein
MPERHVLEHQIPSLAKRGYDLSEYEPEIRFHHVSPWLLAAKKSSNFNTDEYLVGITPVTPPDSSLKTHPLAEMC